jgi:hypothetical protein
MAHKRSVRAVCGFLGLALVFGVSLHGCDGGSGENEVVTPPKPRQGRDSMDAYKADMKTKNAKPSR